MDIHYYLVLFAADQESEWLDLLQIRIQILRNAVVNSVAFVPQTVGRTIPLAVFYSVGRGSSYPLTVVSLHFSASPVEIISSSSILSVYMATPATVFPKFGSVKPDPENGASTAERLNLNDVFVDQFLMGDFDTLDFLKDLTTDPHSFNMDELLDLGNNLFRMI